MKTIETDTMQATMLDDHIVVIRARAGVEIDAATARRDNARIADMMPGRYGMIVDRKADYSIVPVDVYEVLNGLERLQALAIVVYRKMTASGVRVEKQLFNGPLESFDSVEAAQAWLTKVLAGQDPA